MIIIYPVTVIRVLAWMLLVSAAWCVAGAVYLACVLAIVHHRQTKRRRNASLHQETAALTGLRPSDVNADSVLRSCCATWR